MKTVKVTISGIVQGVGFRYFIKEVADQLGITGYAKNKNNGTVEAILQGDSEEVGRLIEICKRGPSMSSIEHIDVYEENNPQIFTTFVIA